MKKNLASNLFFFSVILTLLSWMINEDAGLGFTFGFAFITLDIVTRKKGASDNDHEEVSSTEVKEDNNHFL